MGAAMLLNNNHYHCPLTYTLINATGNGYRHPVISCSAATEFLRPSCHRALIGSRLIRDDQPAPLAGAGMPTARAYHCLSTDQDRPSDSDS